MSEPLSITARYKVINPDAQDVGRVGVAVDVLDEWDVLGWWPALLRGLPRRWRCHWIVLQFPDGSRESFRRSELMEYRDV